MGFHGDVAVPIRLDRTRHLKYTVAAYAKFKRAAGISINQVMERADKAQAEYPLPPDDETPSDEILGKRGAAFLNAIGEDIIPVLVWAGLVHEDKELTLDVAEEICDQAEGDSQEAKIVWLLGKVIDAILLSKGKSPAEIREEAAKKNKAIPQPQPSPTSTQPPSSSG